MRRAFIFLPAWYNQTMPETLTIIALASTLISLGTAFACYVWFQRVKESLAKTLQHSASQQIGHMTRLVDVIQALQQQQKKQEQEIQTLAQSNLKLRQELNEVVAILQSEHADMERQELGQKYLH
ncbi:MAG: hypothetical protein EB121_05295 [Alphaproteobacteria bacterium]|nr:hypothetical protein [Alphaproteobacteria bacterium]